MITCVPFCRYVPTNIPKIEPAELLSWRTEGLSYAQARGDAYVQLRGCYVRSLRLQVAYEVMRKFVGDDQIPAEGTATS
jgi:hypothetical protein